MSGRSTATRHRLAPEIGLDLVATWDDGLIVRIALEPCETSIETAHEGGAAELARWVASWNAGAPIEFDASLLDWLAVPVRTSRILEVLAGVPYGATLDYAELGARCGMPKGARAVGQAMARNPFPLVVPCHRVLLRGGRCGEYSAGGPEVKRKLLVHEGVRL